VQGTAAKRIRQDCKLREVYQRHVVVFVSAATEFPVRRHADFRERFRRRRQIGQDGQIKN